MATLLHFIRSLAVALLTGFLLTLAGLGLWLGGLMALNASPVWFISAPFYVHTSRFLAAFGGGDRIEGMIAISSAVGIVFSLMIGFGSYKRRQRSAWHLAVSNAGED